MKIKITKNFFICFFLISYIFFAAGLNVCAKCFDFLNQPCSCCHSKIISVSVIDSDENQCQCSVKTKTHSAFIIQSLPNLQQLAEWEKTFNSVNILSYLIIFTDTNYSKIPLRPKIALNKNLDMLRTVILLN